MKTLISVRLNESLIHAMLKNARVLHLSRTDYIRKAIELMNYEITRKKRGERLIKASLRVRKTSMKVNAEFNRIERDPQS